MANGGLLKVKEQEELLRLKKNNMRLSRLVIFLALLSISLMGLMGIIMSISHKPDKTKEENITTGLAAVAEIPDIPDITKKNEWQIILVNRDNAVPADFTVDLVAFGYTTVDYRIADKLADMIAAASKDGVMLTVCSGYRSVSQQRDLYDNKKQSYINLGYSEKASEINTDQYIQYPGTSEHHTGLAIDFLTENTVELNDEFADTPAYQWLNEHAKEYGFVERYPKGKSEITGIFWEPWHYRYVGIDNAEAINTMGICLEEYFELIYN